MKTNNILMVGPLPPPNGGATILFECLIQYVKMNDYDVKVIDTSPTTAGAQQGVFNKIFSRLGRFFKVTISILANIQKCKVLFLNVSKNGFVFYLPLCIIICKIFSKKIIVRKFGGDFFDIMKLHGNKSLTLKMLGIADKVFFETKREIELYKSISKKDNVSWFPNCREFDTSPHLTSSLGSGPLKIVFVGEVKPDKGINVLLDSDLSDLNVQIDVFGPLCDGIIKESFRRNSKISYCGILSRDVLTQTLSKYDCLILPTFYKGEGYPGVILEAFSAGLAIITTKWKAIPELITDEINGLLLPINDPVAIRNAITYLEGNPELLLNMKSEALKCRENFEVNKVHFRVIKEVEAIL
nr:glycosyltransferase family 4 protein [uncultured Glaciecola sp.]